LSNVAAWKKATAQPKTKCADDGVKAAAAAWRRFVSCVEALPPDQAAPLWQTAQAAINCHAANVRYWGECVAKLFAALR
jgi:hypothetical protein